jgi:hypothetical protein
MTLPEGVSVKFNVYLLACREVLGRISDLDAATHHDRIITCDTCIERFNETLSRFFERSSGQDIKKAIQGFGDSLHSEAGYIREFNNKAANILDDVVSAILENTKSFVCKSELESFHIKGRDIAIRYFKDSPWINTEQLSNRICYLDIEYGDDDETQSRFCITHSKQHHHLAPMAYYDHRWIEELKEDRPGVIVARFSYEHNFYSYLAYLFWIIHEYMAHVYTIDHRVNEVFNDGWLLQAEDNFLRSREVFDDPSVNSYQINVFADHLVNDLLGNPRRGRDIAFKISSAPLRMPKRFDQITYELAMFQPKVGETATWPTDFINALGNQYIVSRQRLLEKIDTSESIRGLMKTLSIV